MGNRTHNLFLSGSTAVLEMIMFKGSVIWLIILTWSGRMDDWTLILSTRAVTMEKGDWGLPGGCFGFRTCLKTWNDKSCWYSWFVMANLEHFRKWAGLQTTNVATTSLVAASWWLVGTRLTLLRCDMFKRQSSAEPSNNSYKSTKERQQRISFDIFELM